ncbi:MAG TPA: hypothetical protein VN654_26505 [Vicinamibacterales bacterium]|jgi:hypothetical protein|nr:hypothetical protein [Vicinamibacterales bacterium]
MRVRIVRKLADRVDGIDLTHYGVGQVIELPETDGRLIVAEEWGVPARREGDVNGHDGTSATGDRRQTPGDLYQRLKHKRDEIDRRDRRRVYRRDSDATDSASESVS